MLINRCAYDYIIGEEEKTCIEHYQDVLSIDNAIASVSSYAASYITAALSIRSAYGINIQDTHAYQHYPMMLGAACASVLVLLEMVL